MRFLFFTRENGGTVRTTTTKKTVLVVAAPVEGLPVLQPFTQHVCGEDLTVQVGCLLFFPYEPKKTRSSCPIVLRRYQGENKGVTPLFPFYCDERRILRRTAVHSNRDVATNRQTIFH